MREWLASPTILVAIVAIIGIIVSALGSIIALVWMLGGWKGSVDERLKPLAGFGEWKGTVNTKLEQLAVLLAELRTQVAGLARELPKLTVGSQSPTRLKKLGEEIASELNAQEWAKGFADKLEGDAAVQGIHEAYEADTVAFDVVYGQLTDRDEDMSVRVSKCAYRRGLSRDNVLAVLQVVLRDALITRLELDEDA